MLIHAGDQSLLFEPFAQQVILALAPLGDGTPFTVPDISAGTN